MLNEPGSLKDRLKINLDELTCHKNQSVNQSVNQSIILFQYQ